MYTASQHGLEPVKGAFIIKGGPALVSQEEGHLIFIFNISILFFFFFSFCLFRAAPAAYGCSRARGQIGAAATATWDLSHICNLPHSSW